MKALVVDGDRDLLRLVTFSLRHAGYDPIAACDVDSARRLLKEDQPDIVLLDINLGTGGGLDLLSEVRRTGCPPVIVISALSGEDEMVNALNLGADDYLVKPFSHRELDARMRAVLRRAAAGRAIVRGEHAVLSAGPLRMNPAERWVRLDGRLLNLSVTEFRLLQYLMQHAGIVLPTRDIIQHVWDDSDPDRVDMVRVAVLRLRRKLGDDASRPRFIHTIPGAGLMLRPAEDTPAPRHTPPAIVPGVRETR